MTTYNTTVFNWSVLEVFLLQHHIPREISPFPPVYYKELDSVGTGRKRKFDFQIRTVASRFHRTTRANRG